MIEEPNKPGYYWAWFSRFEIEEQTIIEKSVITGDFYSMANRGTMPWCEIAPYILRIEPVTPPSWERKLI